MKTKSVVTTTVLSSMMMLSSCTPENELAEVTVKKSLRIIFDAEIIFTRGANEDNEYVLHVAQFDAESGEEIQNRITQTVSISEGKTTVSVEVAPGTDELVVFAQKKGCNAFDIADMKAIRMTGQVDGLFDCLYGTAKGISNKNNSIDVTLRSPLAGIHVYNTIEDTEYAKMCGIELQGAVTTSTVKNTGTTLHPLSGTVAADEQPVTYRSVLSGQRENIYGEEYYHLGSCYMFYLDKGLVENKFSVLQEGYNRIDNTLTNIPVKQGAETIIAGSFLTCDVTFNIVINPSFDN